MDIASQINLIINLTSPDIKNNTLNTKLFFFYLYLLTNENEDNFICMYNNIINNIKLKKDLTNHNDYYILLISLDEADHKNEDIIKDFDTKLTNNIKKIQKQVNYDLDRTPILRTLVYTFEPLFNLINLEKKLNI